MYPQGATRIIKNCVWLQIRKCRTLWGWARASRYRLSPGKLKWVPGEGLSVLCVAKSSWTLGVPWFWLHMHGLRFTLKSWAEFMAFINAICAWPEATSTTVIDSFVLPVGSIWLQIIKNWVRLYKAHLAVPTGQFCLNQITDSFISRLHPALHLLRGESQE